MRAQLRRTKRKKLATHRNSTHLKVKKQKSTHRSDKGRVGVWRPHILHTVEFSVLREVLLRVQVWVPSVVVGHPDGRNVIKSVIVRGKKFAFCILYSHE